MTSESFLPRIGGGELHVWYLIHRLRAMGHDITLLTNEKKEIESTRTASIFPEPPNTIRIPWSRKNLWPIIRCIWRGAKGVDVIHCHYSYRLAFFAGIVGFLRRVPVVVTLHGLGTLDEAGAVGIYRRVHSLYRYGSLTLATRVISTSDDLAQVAYWHAPSAESKTEIIFNGIDTDLFDRAADLPPSVAEKYSGKKIILTVRRLVPKNGVQFLVESLPLILKRVPDAHLVLLGGGRLWDYIKERIGALGVGDHVAMVGDVENDQVPSYLKRADVVVFPSTAESTSIACAEAMAMGKAVVASRVGGLVELLGSGEERGRLVTLVDWQGSNYEAPPKLSPERYRALAETIADVLEHGDVDRQARARTFAREELDWDTIARKTIVVYQSAIDE